MIGGKTLEWRSTPSAVPEVAEIAVSTVGWVLLKESRSLAFLDSWCWFDLMTILFLCGTFARDSSRSNFVLEDSISWVPTFRWTAFLNLKPEGLSAGIQTNQPKCRCVKVVWNLTWIRFFSYNIARGTECNKFLTIIGMCRFQDSIEFHYQIPRSV